MKEIEIFINHPVNLSSWFLPPNNVAAAKAIATIVRMVWLY